MKRGILAGGAVIVAAAAIFWFVSRKDDAPPSAQSSTAGGEVDRRARSAAERPGLRPATDGSDPDSIVNGRDGGASVRSFEFSDRSAEAIEARRFYEKAIASVETSEEQRAAILQALYDLQQEMAAILREANPRVSPPLDEGEDPRWDVRATLDLGHEFERRVREIVGDEKFNVMWSTVPLSGLQMMFGYSRPLQPVAPDPVGSNG